MIIQHLPTLCVYDHLKAPDQWSELISQSTWPTIVHDTLLSFVPRKSRSLTLSPLLTKQETFHNSAQIYDLLGFPTPGLKYYYENKNKTGVNHLIRNLWRNVTTQLRIFKRQPLSYSHPSKAVLFANLPDYYHQPKTEWSSLSSDSWI